MHMKFYFLGEILLGPYKISLQACYHENSLGFSILQFQWFYFLKNPWGCLILLVFRNFTERRVCMYVCLSFIVRVREWWNLAGVILCVKNVLGILINHPPPPCSLTIFIAFLVRFEDCGLVCNIIFLNVEGMVLIRGG